MAVVLHHVINDRIGYLYRILFVIPMIIPSMVGILIWKYFYEPNSGILNGLLRLMGFIAPTDTVQWLSDPALAERLDAFRTRQTADVLKAELQ